MIHWNWLVEAIKNNTLTDKLIRKKAFSLGMSVKEMKRIANRYKKNLKG